MRLFLAALLAAFTFTPAALGQIDKPTPVPAPNVPGGQVVLVPRDQLRATNQLKTARMHPNIRKAIEAKAIKVPDSWDWTKNSAVKLPMLGNNQYGDCYYVVLCKMFILYQYAVQNSQLTFDTNAVVKRYLQLSGGDNGLSDGDVFPELKAGVIGPNGPHKALDVLVLPSSDLSLLKLAGWAFGPHMFTFTVYTNFSQNVGPGVTFDGNTGRQEGGHAVPLSGRTADGKWLLETWAVQPSVKVTDHWVNGVQPEFISVFSLEWFNSAGYAPNGLHYTELAPLWQSIGGKKLPPSPFPPPAGPPVGAPTIDRTLVPDTLPAEGGNVTITWSSTNASTVAINGVQVPLSGSRVDALRATTSYVFTATGADGATATKTWTVVVGQPTPPPGPSPGSPFQVGFDPVTKTAFLPNGWHAEFPNGGGPVDSLSSGAVAAAIQAGKVDPLTILLDGFAVYAAYKSGDPAALAAAVAKLIADLKGTAQASVPQPMPAKKVPIKAPPTPIRSAVRAVAELARDVAPNFRQHWTFPGPRTRDGLIAHLRADHLIIGGPDILDTFTFEQLLQIHDASHEHRSTPNFGPGQVQPPAAVNPAPTYQLSPATSGGCPNGQCPTQPARRGLFGWR